MATALVVGGASAWVLDREGPHPVLADLAARPWLCGLVALALYWLITLLGLPLGLVGVAPAKGAAWYTTLSLALSVLLVVPAVLRPRDASLYHRFLGRAPLLWLGELSYGIYLWHMPVLGVLARHLDVAPTAASHLTLLVATLVGSVVMAGLTYVLVEQPVRRWSRRRVGSLTAVVRSGTDLGSATSPAAEPA